MAEERKVRCVGLRRGATRRAEESVKMTDEGRERTAQGEVGLAAGERKMRMTAKEAAGWAEKAVK